MNDARTQGVRSIRVGLTKNLGNYESIRIDVELEPMGEEELVESMYERAHDILAEEVEAHASRAQRAELAELARSRGITLPEGF